MSMEPDRAECECFPELWEPKGRNNSGSIIKLEGETRLKHEHGARQGEMRMFSELRELAERSNSGG